MLFRSDKSIAEQYLLQQSLQPLLAEVSAEREKEVETISNHLEISLMTIIDRVQCQYVELLDQKESGSTEAGIDGRLKQIDDRLHELNNRLELRQAQIEQERSCSISNIQHHGRAWVLPHPQRSSPEIAPMVSDAEIEKIAVLKAIEHEEERGWVVESVESQNRGFDLISRKPHPNDSKTAIDVRFIEVKGRSAIGMVGLTSNEYKKAREMKQDYWLYVVFDCATSPTLHIIQDPVQLGWKAIVSVEHYQVDAQKILEVAP